MTVKHEVTLIAFVIHPDGTRSITDIVETSFRNASYFMRSYYRNADVHEVAAVRPGASSESWLCAAKTIHRCHG